MYELSRVRLHSVGPKGARYADVTIDLRDVGRPVARPVQAALFGAASGPVRRPAPASVLFLENGGGKSVLIKLIFSVVLPGRRQIIGTSNTRILSQFVLAEDVAHVALEWQHTVTGERVVTGKASAWPGHVVSNDPGKLVERWYSFRPTEAMSLDALPFTVDGRRVSLTGFGDRLATAQERRPEIQLVWNPTHGQWTEHLDRLGLDPELFRYQRQMNAGEGEAADAFTFATDEAFVGFLLRAVTEEEDPNGLAEVLDGYAERLAQRETLHAERDFVSGALDRLGPLATAAAEAAASSDTLARERGAAQRFVDAIAVRLGIERRRAALLDERRRAAGARERESEQAVRRLNAVELELRRLVTELRLTAARADLGALAARRDDARRLLEGWQATDTLLRLASASAEADSVREVVSAQEEQSRPALAERDRAARRLVRGLIGMARRANQEAAGADDEAAGSRADAERAGAADRRATILAATENEKARAATARVGAARAQVAAAVTEGLLAEDTAADVAASEAARAAASAAREVTATQRELDALGGAIREANAALREAERAAAGAAPVARADADAVDTARRAAEELARQERLAALLGTEIIEPDSDTPTLVTRLAEAIVAAEAEQTDLRMRETADRRMLAALGDGGLLPPTDGIADVLAALEAAGITAWSGWRYLATIPGGERERTLAIYPHLVDGVVLNNPDHLGRARELLDGARLLPRGLVAIGTTVAMTDLGARAPAGTGFLVPPNPALYDEDAAEVYRRDLVDRQARRQRRLAELTDQIGTDSILRQRLVAWSREHPPGHLDRLADIAGRSATTAGAADERRTGCATELERLDETESALRARIPSLRVVETERRATADRLSQLAGVTDQIPGWLEEARLAAQAAEAYGREATGERDRAGRLRDDAEEASRRADDHRRTAAACREELRGVEGGGAEVDDEPDPADPLEALRAGYRAAVTVYQQVAVGYDLRAELTRVERVEADCRARVQNLPGAVRGSAAELIRGPDGADAASRAAATGRAGRAVSDLEEQLTGAGNRVAVLEAEYGKMQPQERALEPYGRPHGIAHGDALIARVHADWETARSEHEAVRGLREDLDRQITAVRELSTGVEAVLDSFTDLPPHQAGDEEDGFDGGVEEARRRRDAVRTALLDAQRSLTDAQRAVRRAADALAQYAGDPAFERVVSPVRRQMLAVDREDLPGYAADWVTALRPRLRTLDDDLRQINIHRTNIIVRLRGMVDGALRTLESAQRLSRLPGGLGDWSDAEFLRIRFVHPDDDLVHDRLGEVVDEAAADGGSGRQPVRRDGMSLLLRGVRAALPKGVRVDMLKPDAVLRTERVRVSEIADVFSGGQLLTAAIILYCTMAALRANDRGQARRPHAGVLFLDNPIGRASAGYLLELQLSVAETLGVQLIYTTGLFDTNALSIFPLVVRLRNDADLRAGLKYLSIGEDIRRPLEDLEPPDGTGRLSATRLFVRPATEPDPGGGTPNGARPGRT